MNHDRVSRPINIGPLLDEQITSFHRTLDVVARERCYLSFLKAPSLDQTREFVLNGRKKGDPRLVAVAEDEVVGWCDISRHFHLTHAHRGTLGMGLLPNFRGQGLGLRLIRATLEEAWAANFTRIELSVHADNTRALALYDRVGFVREGLVRDAVCVDGTYRDAIAMALLRRRPNSS